MQPEVIRDRLTKAIYVIFIAAAVYLTLRYLLGLALPFLIAAVIAELTKRPIDRLSERTKMPRRLASFLTVTLALLAFLGLLWCAVYGLYSAAQAGLEHLPKLLPLLQECAKLFRNAAGALNANLPESLAAQIADAPTAIIQSALEGLTSFLTGIAGRIPSGLLSVAVTVIASYFVSADYHRLGRFARQIFKPQTVEKFITVRKVVLGKLRRLARGYGILLGITFAELTVGLLLLGVKRAVMLALIIALADILPILGTGAFLIPWAVVMLIQGNIPLGVGLAVLYAVVTIVRNVIEPHIIGAQIKLSPLIVLICIFIGYRVFGIWGLLLAPFAASIIRELVVQDII